MKRNHILTSNKMFIVVLPNYYIVYLIQISGRYKSAVIYLLPKKTHGPSLAVIMRDFVNLKTISKFSLPRSSKKTFYSSLWINM